MHVLEQCDIMDTYEQDNPSLARTVRMIVKGEIAHSTVEEELAKALLHAYACLASRDTFLSQRGLFSDYADQA